MTPPAGTGGSAVEETARNIAGFTPDELAAYRAELAAAADDDPQIAHDRAALALAAGRGWVPAVGWNGGAA